MEIKEVPIKKLIPYARNAKIHTEVQVENIANSIEQFGWKQPIVIDKDGVVIVGHGRLMAAEQLKLKTVPCVVADDLTEEEVKAYRIADNKANESEWDFKLLRKELEDLKDFNIDMSDFGIDSFEVEIQHDEHQVATQSRVSNILNLDKGDYRDEGYYGIPVIKPVYDLPPIKEWIGFNEVLSDKEPSGKAVHFFIDDYQFERIWNNTDKYVDKLRKYVCVASPDFSPYGNMPLALQIYNHYRKHWVARYLQDHGVTVIPTIRETKHREGDKWCYEGEPVGGIVIISAMWSNDEDKIERNKYHYNLMKTLLKPKKIFVYGTNASNLGIAEGDNVEFIRDFSQRRYDKNARKK